MAGSQSLHSLCTVTERSRSGPRCTWQELIPGIGARVRLRSIARDLRKLGVPTASGTEWSPEGVRGVPLRPRNAGFMAHPQSPSRPRALPPPV